MKSSELRSGFPERPIKKSQDPMRYSHCCNLMAAGGHRCSHISHSKACRRYEDEKPSTAPKSSFRILRNRDRGIHQADQ